MQLRSKNKLDVFYDRHVQIAGQKIKSNSLGQYVFGRLQHCQVTFSFCRMQEWRHGLRQLSCLKPSDRLVHSHRFGIVMFAPLLPTLVDVAASVFRLRQLIQTRHRHSWLRVTF